MRPQVTVGIRSFGLGKRATQASVYDGNIRAVRRWENSLISNLGAQPRTCFDKKLVNSIKERCVFLTKVS